MPPKKKEEKKKEEIDFILGKDDVDSYSFGYDIMQCLVRKGFCVIKSDQTPDEITKDLGKEVQSLYAQGKFGKPPAELVEGLLGQYGSARMAYPDFSSCEKLANVDAQVDSFLGLVDSLTEDYLGFQVACRTEPVLLEAGVAEEPPAEMTVPEAWKWLNWFQWHRFMCIFFTGPASGKLELKPFDDFSATHEVIATPGLFVILRTDWLSHTFTPESQCWTMNSFFLQRQTDAPMGRKKATFPMCPAGKQLDAWLMGALRDLKQSVETEDEYEQICTRQVQKMSNHLYHKGMQIAIRGMACRLPASSPNIDAYQVALLMGTDGGGKIPFKRWDADIYYRTEPQDGYWVRDTYTCCHGTFIDGIELFDHKFFGLSLNETRGMDPNQRLMLECCYEVCWNAGFKKSTLMRSDIGCFTAGAAGVQMEWASVPKVTDEGGALASTNGSPAILGNRLSYTFGMNGPNFLSDMDAASFLCSFGLAVDSSLPHKAQCDAALALGIDIILHPVAYWYPSWAGLLSMRGRSLTFDHTADGYIRGEGSGGVYVNPLMREVDGEYQLVEKPPMRGLVSGFYMNNSGKVAHIGAPSGAMDQDLISTCLRKAEVSPLDIDVLECHGMGSLLSDAVEVTAASKTYRGRAGAEETLGVTSAKSNFGSLKPASGVCSVMKMLVSMHGGHQLAGIHLQRVNPHMLLEDSSINFITEHMPTSISSSFQATTNKGLGGTNVHFILWGEIDTNKVSKYAVQPERHEQIVFWPAGGGELMSDAQPRKQYTIVCNFNNWKPAPMQSEGKGVWTYTVTLSEHLTERFQIWLDGDNEKVLHPSKPDADKDMAVHGPDEADDADGSYWLIDGRSGYGAGLALADEGGEAPKDTKDAGAAGTQYLITFSVNGQYRLVTWEKVAVEEGAIVQVPETKYYVIGSWNGFEPVEMQVEESMAGVFYYDAQITRSIATFSIMRNKDWHQAIYPTTPYCMAESCNPVLGPDDGGRAMDWALQGQAGDVFKIELQRSSENGLAPMQISWRRVANMSLPPAVQYSLFDQTYSFVSSLERWNFRHKMKHVPGRGYLLEIDVPADGFIAFQILQGGDWGSIIHPDMPDAGARDDFRTVGPQYSSNCWKVGKYMEERGGHYEVCFEAATAQAPMKVSWQRK